MAPGAGATAGSRLRFAEPRVALPPARVGETTTRSVAISNVSDVWVEILDFTRQYPERTAITTSGIDDTGLDPGESTQVHFAFTPTREARAFQLLYAETSRGPDTGIELVGRGKRSLAAAAAAHEPGAREAQADAARAADHAAAKSAVHHGRVPALDTYDQLEAAFILVFDLTDRSEWAEATAVADALVERMAVLCRPDHMRAAFRRHGVTGTTPERFAYAAQDAVNNVHGRLAMQADLSRATNLPTFQLAGKVLRALTDEPTDLAEYRAFDRHTMALGAVSAIPALVVLGPYVVAELPALAPVLAQEASLLAYSASSLFATIYTWIATHPEEALAWAEVATAVGVEAGEDPKAFYRKLQTTEGWYELAVNILFAVLPARGSRAGAGTDEPAGDAPPRPRSGAADVEPATGSAAPGAARSRVLGEPEVVDQASRTAAGRLRNFAAAARARADQTIGPQGAAAARPGAAAPVPGNATATAGPSPSPTTTGPVTTAARTDEPATATIGARPGGRGRPSAIDDDAGEDVVESTGAVIASSQEEVRGPFELRPLSTLTARQRAIHAKLANQRDMAKFHKREVSMKDLLAIGRVTGDEYSVYTIGSRRLVIRGIANRVYAPDKAFREALLAGEHGKWSGHTHSPGFSNTPGPGDRSMVPEGTQSAIWADNGVRPLARTPQEEDEFAQERRRQEFRRMYDASR